ncbi:MAG: DUF885 family protein, partial [Nitrososphaerales archaeon]
MPPKPDATLSSLAREYWEVRLADEPLFATVIGDRRFDNTLRDITPQGRLRIQRQYESILQRCRSIRGEPLSDADRLTLTTLLVDVRAQLDYLSCGLDDWTVDPLDGPQVQFLNIESFQPVRTVEEGRAIVERWRSVGRYLDDYVANLRRGAREGKIAVRIEVEKAVDETEELLAKPDGEWAFMRPTLVAHEDWTEADRTRFKDGVTA